MPRVELRNMNQVSEGAAAIVVERASLLDGRFLKPEEFAKHLGISLRWIYRHIKDIPHHASENMYGLISNRPPFVSGSKAWSSGHNNDGFQQAAL